MQPSTETTVSQPLSLKELSTLLVKHFGYHEGLYDIALAMQIAVGQVGPAIDQQLPGAAFAVSGIGLARVQQLGTNTIDAAVVNPPVKPTKPSTKKPRKVVRE